jgi:hypothetical protein
MQQLLEKYVTTNETHALETFFDHEVFRKSYHEVRRSLIEQQTGSGGGEVSIAQYLYGPAPGADPRETN